MGRMPFIYPSLHKEIGMVEETLLEQDESKELYSYRVEGNNKKKKKKKEEEE